MVEKWGGGVTLMVNMLLILNAYIECSIWNDTKI